MRKELLLQKKRGIIKNLKWCAETIITDDILNQFSIPQLHTLCKVLELTENYKESKEAFYALSACEVLQKSTGKIAYFDNSGIREETEEEVLSGAASQIFKSYKQKKKQ